MIPPTPNDLYRAIQILVRQGQPVFPCKPSGLKAKAPLTKNGLHDATTDLDIIKGWWKRNGKAAIGIPTGIVWDVLDVDVKNENDGRIHLARLQRGGLLNGCKRVVRTPSGGLHLYFRASPGLTNKASAALGLDVRAKGGYVLAAPSYIENAGEDDVTGSYEDMGVPDGGNDDPLFWDAIVPVLRPVNTNTNDPIELPSRENHGSLPALRVFVANAKSGERNNSLHWAVHRCIEHGFDPFELMESALHCGLGEEEVTKTINSALHRVGVTLEELSSEVDALFPEN